jgi:hypothetical protein
MVAGQRHVGVENNFRPTIPDAVLTLLETIGPDGPPETAFPVVSV